MPRPVSKPWSDDLLLRTSGTQSSSRSAQVFLSLSQRHRTRFLGRQTVLPPQPRTEAKRTSRLAYDTREYSLTTGRNSKLPIRRNLVSANFLIEGRARIMDPQSWRKPAKCIRNHIVRLAEFLFSQSWSFHFTCKNVFSILPSVSYFWTYTQLWRHILAYVLDSIVSLLSHFLLSLVIFDR